MLNIFYSNSKLAHLVKECSLELDVMISMILPGCCSILLTTETKITKSDLHHTLENIIEIVNTYHLQAVPCDVHKTPYNSAL